MAHSTPIFILSLLLLATISNACGTCMLASPPPPTPATTCSTDTLKLGVCADLLGGVVGSIIGTPTSSSCCALLEGLANLEVALCLCIAIKANVLGINLNIPVALGTIIDACGKSVPPGYECE
ncbi:hypothetical protein NL676_034106 [Syzygium grande]|nr:hypothetical protein NL676_034106 [Syzygium grande]